MKKQQSKFYDKTNQHTDQSQNSTSTKKSRTEKIGDYVDYEEVDE